MPGIGRLPARYFDPVTQLPYATLQAFRVLREAYYQQLEDKGDPRNKEVARWLAWRKDYKKTRASAQTLKPTVTPLQTIPATPPAAHQQQQPQQHRQAAVGAAPALSSQQLIGVMQSLGGTLAGSGAGTTPVTSVAAVAHILRASGIGALNATPAASVVASSTLATPRVTPSMVISAPHSAAGGTVQLVQALSSRGTNVAAGAGTLVHRSTPHMVVVSSAGAPAAGGIHLVGSTSGAAINSNITSLSNLLVQGNTGANLLVQGNGAGAVPNVQIVQAGAGQGNLQVIQAGSVVQAANSSQNVQVLQGSGRITLRPVANQTFTNLQSLLK